MMTNTLEEDNFSEYALREGGRDLGRQKKSPLELVCVCTLSNQNVSHQSALQT